MYPRDQKALDDILDVSGEIAEAIMEPELRIYKADTLDCGHLKIAKGLLLYIQHLEKRIELLEKN